MHGKILITLAIASAFCNGAAAQDVKSVLEATIKNMGDVKSIQYSGSGAVFTLGQSVSSTSPWPRVELKSFTRAVDYDKLATRHEASGPQGPVPSQFLVGDKAWGQTASNVTPAAPVVATERQLQIWLTPHGFLKGALANNAKMKKRGKARLVTFTTPGKHRITGTISGEQLVEKVESSLYNPVLGDMPVETTYSDYRDFGGFRFPAKILQKQGGFPIFDLTVTAAQRFGVQALACC